MILSSVDNAKVKHAVALQAAKARKEFGQCLAQGLKVYQTLVDAGWVVDTIFVTQKVHEENDFEKNHQLIVQVSDSVMKKISTSVTSAELVAIFQIPKQSETVKISQNSVILCDIQDPGNVGTLIRTAAAMGVECVVSVGGADVYQPKVIQASAGTIGNIKIIQTDWKTLRAQNAEVKFGALVVNGGQAMNKTVLVDTVIVLGNEGQGLPQQVIDACAKKLTIHMQGKTESLNVAVAGAIAMYEKMKK